MKTKYFQSKPGILVCSLTGKEYGFSVGNEASRLAAVNKLAANQSAELERVNNAALPRRRQEVSHPETRSATPTPGLHSSELMRAKTELIRYNGTPAKPVNPADKAIEAEIARHYTGWESSHNGRRVIANLKRQSKEWEAKQLAKTQQADFEKSLAPVVDHARSNRDAVRNDPAATQLEVEQAEERYKLAQSGDVAGYSAADKKWRQRQSEKIVAQTVEVDSQLNQLRQQRDALLQAAYEKPAESEPTMVEVWYPPNYIDPAKAGKTILEPMPQ